MSDCQFVLIFISLHYLLNLCNNSSLLLKIVFLKLGSGKTATVIALAKELGLELVSWENPVESVSYQDRNR